MKKSAVIIGGGLSGLHCGLLLLKKGLDVTILEQHITVGGLAAGFRRKGYYFDSCMSRFASDSLAGYFKEAGLGGFEFREHHASLRIGGKTYPTRSVTDFIAACADAFPQEAGAIHKLYDDRMKSACAFMAIQNGAGAMSYKGLGLMGGMVKTMAKTVASGSARGMGDLMKSFNVSLQSVLNEYFAEDSPAAAFLFNLTDVFGKGGETSLMTFLGSISANMELNRYPAGGFQRLCDAYTDEIRRLGGTIVTAARAARIRCGNGRAEGVEYTHKGSALFAAADYVISAADIRKLYTELLDKELADSGTLALLDKQETTAPLPIMYLGIRLGSEVIRERFAGAEELIYYPGGTAQSEEDFYTAAPLILHSSSLGNADHAPDGCGSIQIYLASPPNKWMGGWGRAGGEYKNIKQTVIRQVMDNVCAVFPELADASLIDVCELGTPHTVERYTGNTGGAHCGFTWDRARNTFNPPMGSCKVRTDAAPNLLTIGHWTGFMGGVTNAFASARQAAGIIR